MSNSKTKTYGNNGPELTTLQGHVSDDAFKKAFSQEWKGDFNDEMPIQHVHAVIEKGKGFRIVSSSEKGARPYTVQRWE